MPSQLFLNQLSLLIKKAYKEVIKKINQKNYKFVSTVLPESNRKFAERYNH